MDFQETRISRPIGVNADLSPYELPPETWTRAENASSTDFRTNRIAGATWVYGQFTIAPVFLMPFYDGTGQTWLVANSEVISADARIQKVNSANVISDMVTGLSATWLSGVQGCYLNGINIINNGVDAPQSTTSSGVFSGTSMEDLPNWGEGETTWVCKSIRSYKNFLIAMNTTEGGSEYPFRVRWSGPAAAGVVPSSWDAADPATRAGFFDIADTAGFVVDGLALGDSFIVYKEDAVWSLDFIGGTSVFQFRKVFEDDNGILAQGCVAEIEGKHFVMAKGDAYIHDGVSKRSVMTSRVQSLISGVMDQDYWVKTRVVADHANKEVWVYYVTQGNAPACDSALVYNWETDQWNTRDLSITGGVSFIAQGIVQDASGDTWATDSDTWLSDTSLWDEGAYTPDQLSLVACSPERARLLELNSGTTWDGETIVTTLERTGVDFGDQPNWKRINAIYPSFTGSGVVNISIGYENPVGSGVAWEGPYPFEIGVDYKVNCRSNGRNMGIRFESTDNNVWSLTSYTVEWKPTKANR